MWAFAKTKKCVVLDDASKQPNQKQKKNHSFYLTDGAAYKWKRNPTTFVLNNMGMLYICTFAYVTCETVATFAITIGCA